MVEGAEHARVRPGQSGRVHFAATAIGRVLGGTKKNEGKGETSEKKRAEDGIGDGGFFVLNEMRRNERKQADRTELKAHVAAAPAATPPSRT